MGSKSPEPPFVVYELVGTGKTVVQRFDASQPFDAFKLKVSASLGLGGAASASGITIKSVREGGKEVELDDRFDYEGLKARASAVAAQGDGASLLIRVHATQHVASSSKSPYAATPAPVSSINKGKRRASDASTSPVAAATPATASTKKKKKKKQDSSSGLAPVMDSAQSSAPPTPSPASSKRPRETSPPSVFTPAESSPATKRRKILPPSSPLPPLPGHANLYKPHRPSPLGQQISREEQEAEDAAAASRANKRRRRKSKGPSVAPDGENSASSSPQKTSTTAQSINATTVKAVDAAPFPAPAASADVRFNSTFTTKSAPSEPVALTVAPPKPVKAKKTPKIKSTLAPSGTVHPVVPTSTNAATQPTTVAPQPVLESITKIKKPKTASKSMSASAEMSPAASATAQFSASTENTAKDEVVKTKKAKRTPKAASASAIDPAPAIAIATAAPIAVAESGSTATESSVKATPAKTGGKVIEKTPKPVSQRASTATAIMAAYREKLRLEAEEKKRQIATETAIPEPQPEVPAVSEPAMSQESVQTAADEKDAEEPSAHSSIPGSADTSTAAGKKNRRKSKVAEAASPQAPLLETDQSQSETQDNLQTGQAATAEVSGVKALPSTPASVIPKKVSTPRTASPLSADQSAARPGAKAGSAKKSRLSLSETARTAMRDAPEDRVACTLCGETPLHLQKECPVTIGGLETVETVLAQKRRLAQDRPGDMTLKKSIEALSTWQDRLARQGRHPGGDRIEDKTPERSVIPLQVNTSEIAPAPETETPAEGDSTVADDELRETSEADATPTATPAKTSSLATSPVRLNSAPPSPPSAIPAPIGRPYPARSVLLSKQGTPSKSSRSGISQSDVVFQTADEDTSSSGSTGESSESDSHATSSSGDDSDGSSGSGDSEDAESEQAGEAPPTDDPEELMRHFFGNPLSQQLKKKARLSGISHIPARLPSKSPEDVSGSEDELATADRSRRQESLSSVDVEDEDEEGVEEDEEKIADAARDIAKSSSPLAARSGASQAEIHHEPNDISVDEGSALSRAHSFAEMAMPSPTVAVDGDQAMEDAMAEDDEPDAWASIQTQPDNYQIHAGRISKGLPSPPSSASSSKELSPSINIPLTQSNGDVEMAVASPEKGPRWSVSPVKQQQPLVPVANEQSGLQAEATPTARRVTRSVSRDPVPVAGPSRMISRPQRSTSKDPVSSTAPADGGRRLRSVSRDIPTSLPASPAQSRRSSARVTRGQAASQEMPSAQPTSQSIFKPTSKSKKTPLIESQPSQPLRRSSRRASTQEPIETSSQIDELASEPPSAPPNGESRFPSPVPEDDGEAEDDHVRHTETQFTQVQSSAQRDPGHPLFLSLGSYPQQTQHYNAHPDVSSSILEDAPPSSPVPNGQLERPSSPSHHNDEEDEEEIYGSAAEHISPSVSKRGDHRSPLSSEAANGYHAEAASDDSESSEDLQSLPAGKPLQTSRRAHNSQPLPAKATGIFASHIPTLSSLSSELLRMGRNAIGSPRTSVSASQPNTPSIFQTAEEDSSEDSDSSAEGAVPSALASRVAGAAKKPRRSMRDSMGW